MSFLRPLRREPSEVKYEVHSIPTSASLHDRLANDDKVTRLPSLGSPSKYKRKQRIYTQLHAGEGISMNQLLTTPANSNFHYRQQRQHHKNLNKKSNIRSNKKPEHASGSHTLSPMDERILILYHSSLKRTWRQHDADQETYESTLLIRKYGVEATYAATQIQKVARGVAARKWFAAFDGPKFQRAARQIQFAFRRLVVCHNIFRRLMKKKHDMARKIQAWYRGVRCRDLLLYDRARLLNERIILFQRAYRGRRFWRVVVVLLHDRRNKACVVIQRVYRGWRGRRLAKEIHFEQLRYARELQESCRIHQRTPRCKHCTIGECTEDSLFQCFMARYIGLHDLNGAQLLCLDGVRLFPRSAKFHFLYAVLLQAMGQDLETAMTFLNKARILLNAQDDELKQYEKQFFLPALQLRPNDVATYLDLAVFCQCLGNIPRAETYYTKALTQFPPDYDVPGYLHRIHMVDRLLLNYHRFRCVFNSRQVNILSKTIPITKKGEKIRFMVAKLNHFTVITPADTECICRFNAIYLTDDEFYSISQKQEISTSSLPKATQDRNHSRVRGKDPTDSEGTRPFRTLAEWRSSTAQAPMTRRRPKNNVKDSLNNTRVQENIITQLYQQEFLGQNIQPEELSRFSQTRSKLTVTREQAEMLLKELVFIHPNEPNNVLAQDHYHVSKSVSSLPDPSPSNRVVLLPSVLKIRQQHTREVECSWATVNIQRVFRGFRIRADIRRDRLLHTIQQRQVDSMFRQLQANLLVREKRQKAAIAIQRIFKGFILRKHLRWWQVEAIQIQRIFRGYRGRKRAIAFREGNCTFYMAERVYQRGVDISGRHVFLVIEKCGLSFSFHGYDFENCTTYPGFFSHESSLGLLCYWNWTYGESFAGREVVMHGQRLVIDSVAFVCHDTGECYMNCHTDSQVPAPSCNRSEPSVVVTLSDCVNAINLRSLATMGKNREVLELPITLNDTERLVHAMTDRLVLVDTLPMASKELKDKTPGGYIISVAPPPGTHYVYRKSASAGQDVFSTKTIIRQPTTTQHQLRTQSQIVFPVVDGLRGVTIGKNHFRKKCSRHAINYSRCRCVLPVVTTSAHVETISLALALPASSHDHH